MPAAHPGSRDRHGHVQTLAMSTRRIRKYTRCGRPGVRACTRAMLCAFRRPAVKVERVAREGNGRASYSPCDRAGECREVTETREYETRCPHRRAAYTGFVRVNAESKRTSREQTNRQLSAGGHQVRGLGCPPLIYFSVLATSGTFAAAPR